MPNRRQFAGLLASGAVVSAGLAACATKGSQSQYDQEAKALRANLRQSPELIDMVRNAVLAPSGHNTQPWRFQLSPSAVTIGPDLARRTPVVDPDDHHLFVGLGCAVENLCLAATVAGRPAAASLLGAGDRLEIGLDRSAPKPSTLADAIPVRQSTRSVYTGQSVPGDSLKALEVAARTWGVSVLIFTDKKPIMALSDLVIAGNDRQMDDQAFVVELKKWIRFNPEAAISSGDGLYTVASGSPSLPGWLGQAIFPLVFSKASETDKYVSQIRSSAGVAIFIGDKPDKDHWVKVGRSFQRFALQATASGLKLAMINQPVEVASVRSDLARWLGMPNARPDLVVRFGYAKPLPWSLRRPLKDVVWHA